MEVLHEELQEQRGLVEQVLGNELPALRMEIAFLRADLQALEERLGGEQPIFPEDSRRYTRSGVELPLAAAPRQGRAHRDDPRRLHKLQQHQRGSTLDLCHESDQDEDLRVSPRLEFDMEADTGMAVSLEPNVWDCSLMIALYGWNAGSELFGRFNVLVTAGLLAANTLMQFLFVLAVKSMIEYNPYEDEAMLNMRLQEGQHYSNMDHKTMTTKAQRTCDLKAYNMLGETVEWVSDYLLKNKGKDMVLSGDVICTLALITWVVSIYSEVRRVWQDLVSTVMNLPTSDEVVTEHRAGLLIIAGVPWSHKLSCVCVMLPRVLIAFALCWYGMMFLAGTIELRELLTNAVALEFVKSIDEMLFEAIMPRKLMGYIRVVKLRIFQGLLPNEALGGKFGMRGYHDLEADGSPRRSKSIAVQTCYVLVRLIVIAGAVVAGYLIFLQPIVGYTEDAYNMLCGENTNFTFIVHPITRVPVFANIDPFSQFSKRSETGTLRCFYAAQYEMLRMRAGFPPQYNRSVNETLMSLINGSNKLCWVEGFERSPVSCPEQNIGYFNWLAVASEKEFWGDWNYCRDQDVFLQVLKSTCLNYTFFVESSQELKFFKDVETCRDFDASMACNRTTHSELSFLWTLQIQKLCPETCGQCRFDHGGHKRHHWWKYRVDMPQPPSAGVPAPISPMAPAPSAMEEPPETPEPTPAPLWQPTVPAAPPLPAATLPAPSAPPTVVVLPVAPGGGVPPVNGLYPGTSR